MTLYPNGFLSTMFCLRAIPQALFAEVAAGNDSNDAQAGELLLLPQSSSCEGVCGDSFLGLESMGETTVARVCPSTGGQLLVEAKGAAKDLAGDDAELEKAVFKQLIELSGRLQELGCEGGLVRVVREGTRVYLHPHNEDRRVLAGAVAGA